MPNLGDPQRTQHGLVELRKRYIRRAIFLSRSKEYRDAIIASRRAWNEQHSKWLMVPGVPEEQRVHRRLEREWEAEYRRSIARDPIGMEHWYQDTTLESLLEDVLPAMELDIALHFWPAENYPNPYSKRRHPALPFVRESFYRDPKLLDDECDRLFPPFELTPNVPSEGNWALRSAYIDGVLTWCLPLYPGITVTDIRAAADDIARQANHAFIQATPLARIVELRKQGLTHKAISEQLGIHEKTVAAALSDIPTPEK